MATTGWIQGKNLRMAVGAKVILGAKKCSYKISPKYANVLNKDTSNYNELMPDSIDWSMSVDADMTFATDANKTTHTVLLAASLGFTKLTATFSTMSNIASPIPVSGDQLLTGFVRIGDLSVDADVNGTAGAKYDFMGDGALVQTTVA